VFSSTVPEQIGTGPEVLTNKIQKKKTKSSRDEGHEGGGTNDVRRETFFGGER